MSDPYELLLSQLQAVRRTGPDTAMARCPAHEDRRPSLSVRRGDDGRVLAYCFAGCGAADVVGAVGLDLADLFPPRPEPYPRSRRGSRRTAPPIPARHALELMAEDALLVEVVAHRLRQGEPAEQHAELLADAAARIHAIRSAWRLAP